MGVGEQSLMRSRESILRRPRAFSVVWVGVFWSVCSRMVERAAPVRAGPSRDNRMKRLQDRSPPAQRQESIERASSFKFYVFIILFACLLIPGSFFVAGARFTPYRAFLLIAFVPLAIGFLRGAAGRITNVDVLIILYGFWMVLVMIRDLGFERIDFIIIQLVEAICGYLIGRVLIRNATDYRLFFRCFFWGLLFILPFGILEMLTKQNLVSQIAGIFLQPYEQATHPPRLGLHRAQTSFEHPILFGLFCSLGFANALYIFQGERLRRAFWTGVVFLSTFTALSSAPLLAIIIQITMMVWDRLVKLAQSKWFILVGLGVSAFLILELLTPNGAVDFLIANFTLVPATAEYRLMTIQYVMDSLFQNPFFGVGEGEDVGLPWWHTGSIDNFWLVTAVSFGLPAFFFLFGAMVVHLSRVAMVSSGSDETVLQYRTGHFIAVTGLIFILVTVHIWGATNVMVMTYIGAGAWIYAPQTSRSRSTVRRRHGASGGPLNSGSPQGGSSSPESNKTTPVTSAAGPQIVTKDRMRVRGSTGRYGGGQL